MAQMQFRQPGGFAVIPDPNGANTFNGDPSPLQGALAQCQGGAASVPDFLPAAVRAQPAAVADPDRGRGPDGGRCGLCHKLFTGALGPPEHVGGVLVWPHRDTGS
jgi:hypothetical protein